MSCWTSIDPLVLESLPPEMFKDKDVFQQVLQVAWQEMPGESRTRIMDGFMPKLLAPSTKEQTTDLLTSGNLKSFEIDPLDSIYFNLKISKLAPEIKQTLCEVRTLHLKAHRLREKERQMKIWSEVINRRRSLLKSSLNVACDDVIKSRPIEEEDESKWSPKCSLVLSKSEAVRIKRSVNERYKKELTKLTDETEVNFLNSSDDEVNYPDLKPSLKSGKVADEKRMTKLLKSYKRKRKLNDVEELKNISLEDIMARVSGTVEDEIPLEFPIVPAAIKPKIRRKSKPAIPVICKAMPASCPSQTKSTSSVKCPRESIGSVILARKMEMNLNKKEYSADVFDFDDDSPSELLSVSKSVTCSSTTPASGGGNIGSSSISNQVTKIINSLSSSASTSSCPSSSPSMAASKVSPCATMTFDKPPSSFFALIRDIFRDHAPSDHKLTLHKLEELVKDKLKTIDPKIGWSHESVQSAMNFLSYYSEPIQSPPKAPTPTNESQDSSSSFSGGEMVPLVDYKEKNQQWQWIGGDRDGDDVLMRMCDEWNTEKDRNPSSLSDPTQPVPPPLFPTSWIVKTATPEDQKIYREQEAIRYNNPSKAFTYRVHGYASVVGPVKGCVVTNAPINTIPPPPVASCSASPNKAREHSLLAYDRPTFVTLLSLVRDAAARLPNGEGTRADICELLKDSQYLLPTVSDQQVNQIVSGALDRLHYEKDPCVKYDVNRKVWIYLHRNRTEQDFERLHEMQVAAAKAKRNMSKNHRKPSLPKTPTTAPPSLPSPPASGSNSKQVPKLQRPITPCKSSDSNSSSNTPILPSPGTPSVPARIPVSPLAPKLSVAAQTQAVDKSVMDILNKSIPTQTYQVPSNFQLLKKNCKDTIFQLTPNSSSGDNPAPSSATAASHHKASEPPVIRASAATISQPVVSMIPVSSFNTVNKIITTNPPMAKDRFVTRTTTPQKVGNSPIRPLTSVHEQVICPRKPIATTSTVRVTQPITRQIQLPSQATNSIQLPPGTQSISLPNNMILGGKPGHVVLGGKSYMMATTSGGSIVLHPQNCGTIAPPHNNNASGSGQPMPIRTLQGIKVIPVPAQFNTAGGQRVTPVLTAHPGGAQNGTQLGHSGQQFVRLISTRPTLQANQVLIPNSTYQQVILTPTPTQTVQTLAPQKVQQINVQNAITRPATFQNQVCTPTVTTIPRPEANNTHHIQ